MLVTTDLKLFLLALLLTMGTTLMSCKYDDGKKQKIDNVILIDSIEKVEEKKNSIISTLKDTLKPKLKVPPPPTVLGITICPTPPIQKQDSIIDITEMGEIITVEGDIAYEDVDIINPDILFAIVDQPPRFKESKKLLKEKAREEFEKKINEFVKENFDVETTINLGLSPGKYKIYIQFTIDEIGNLTVINTRAPHKWLEKEARRMIQKLPQLIPAKHKGNLVKMKYMLPVVLM